MAESTKARRVSRRKAMSILGSGVAVGVGWQSVELGAIPCTKPATAVVIRPPRRTGGARGPAAGGGVLQSLSCCEETRTVIIQAAQQSSVGGKHLKPIADQLNTLGIGALEEYCFMVWGLTDAQREELAATMKQKYEAWFSK